MSTDLALAERTVRALSVMSEIRAIALEAWECFDEEHSKEPAEIKQLLIAHQNHLYEIMPEIKSQSNLGRHIDFNMKQDYRDIYIHDLAQIEKALLRMLQQQPGDSKSVDFKNLLHKKIAERCLPLYVDKHYRQSVLAAYDEMTSVLRKKTGLKIDGVDLANQSLSGNNPRILIQEGDDQTAINLRAGYADLVRGAYRGIRNVYTHEGNLEVRQEKAAQHLIFASLLMRRLCVAVVPPLP